MFCPKCGSGVNANAAFCGACGAPIGAGVVPLQVLTRPGIVTLLAVLQFIAATILLLGGAIGTFAALMSEDPDRGLGLLAAVVLGGVGVLQLACGIGLWKLKPYGRVLQIVLAVIGLLGIPIGTIISIFILIYMFKPGIRALFSGKAIPELTRAELVEIAALTQGSQATTVIVVVLVGLASFVVLGILAAIAVPGLLRARMAGNEAAAIGSLRAINTAQASYAAAAGAGRYAVTLAVLAAACPGSSQGFISPELSRDPSVKSGYTFNLESAGAGAGADDCNGVRTEIDYYATGVPVRAGTTGARGFATSAAGTIFFDPSGAAPSRSDTLAATARVVE